jgi:hypothetical protein
MDAMAELDTLLEQAETTHREMQAALQSNDEKALRNIIGLRTKFAGHMSEMVGAVKNDSRLLANPELAREFEERFLEVRQQLARHQAKYRMTSMEENETEYRQSVVDVGRLQEDFYTWAKAALAKV